MVGESVITEEIVSVETLVIVDVGALSSVSVGDEVEGCVAVGDGSGDGCTTTS